MAWFYNVGYLLLSLLGIIKSPGLNTDSNVSQYKVVCYLGSWANYRHRDGKFVIEDINPHLCTHAIYGFAKLENNKIASHDPYLDLKENWGLGAYERFNNLRKKNGHLRTLIAIGGRNEGSAKYSAMAADPNARATFVKSAVDFCLKYKFNGLDVNWKYPANKGGTPQDKQNYVTLLKELKEAFASHGLILSAAVAAGKSIIDTAYDIPEISKYLDFINVMAYDFHGPWEGKTGIHAPLQAMPDASEYDKILTVDYAIKYWIQNGAPKEKLVLGMGTYGKSFILSNATDNGLGASTTGPGTPGPFTAQDGMLGYNEICRDRKWKEVFVPHVDAPYAFKGNQWVGYDNKKSIGLKVDYLIQEGLGGGMIWSLETDDFRGKCRHGKFPLLSTIASKLLGGKQAPETNAETTTPPYFDETTEPDVTTTTETSNEFECTKRGYFRDPSDCSVYYYCQSDGQGGFSKHKLRCAPGLAFDEDLGVCIRKTDVPECS